MVMVMQLKFSKVLLVRRRYRWPVLFAVEKELLLRISARYVMAKVLLMEKKPQKRKP